MNEHFFIYNGFLFRHSRPVIAPGHPSFSYGDGLFETMRMHNGKIINVQLHLERLKYGMEVLEYVPDHNFFQNILENTRVLLQKNQHGSSARIRLSVARSANSFAGSNSGIDYLIETDQLEAPAFDARGITALIYKSSWKGGGALANLKSKNYLLNILTYRYAQAHGADTGILLNGGGRICEAAIANIYFAENGKLFTPALEEGCVAGTVRRWLLHHLTSLPVAIFETECTIERLMNADEVFISNAIRWVQPIRRIDEREFPVKISKDIFQLMEKSLL